MPLILPGNVASALPTGFDVANSCRFNDGDSAKMLKQMGTATDNKKFTFNCWLKRCTLGTNQVFAHARTGTSGPYFNMMFGTDDKLRVYGPDKDGGNDFDYKTTQVLKDVGAWYCITVAFDSSHATAGNRIRMYINGVEVTSFATETNPAEDVIYVGNYTGYDFGIGANLDNSAYFDGYMAECVHIDGQQLTPSSFGEFDEDSPTIWKPIDVSGLTFGNNGFYLDFEDSSNLGNDANGGTDLTETNVAATDQTSDSPTNNFAVINSLHPEHDMTFSEGNTQIATTTSAWREVACTIAPNKGKWYFETKITGATYNWWVGIVDPSLVVTGNAKFADWLRGYAFSYSGDGATGESGSAAETTWANASMDDVDTNDIVGCAFDLDNNKIYFSVRGAWVYGASDGSSDPTSGATGTGSFKNLASPYNYTPAFSLHGTGSGAGIAFNSGGSPPYAISSANADGNGYGNFEYAVPSGYYALCTKNLAEFG